MNTQNRKQQQGDDNISGQIITPDIHDNAVNKSKKVKTTITQKDDECKKPTKQPNVESV